MSRDWQTNEDRLQEIKAIAEAPGETFYGSITKEGIVLQDVADASEDFEWLIGQVETEKERADKLEERHNSLLKVVQEATEYMSWRNEGNGPEIALKLIYKWLEANPMPKEEERGSDKTNL
ncbi:hypothetical protein [Paenibacillus solani]|uniref:hypothetical protein n=1 Tax=Paenibacillus solani TaxID=1705565 RepID=UPI003D2A1941